MDLVNKSVLDIRLLSMSSSNTVVLRVVSGVRKGIRSKLLSCTRKVPLYKCACHSDRL